MANGKMGAKVDPQTKKRGLELLSKGNTIQQVAKRLGVSESLVRIWHHERKKALEASQEPERTNEA